MMLYLNTISYFANVLDEKYIYERCVDLSLEDFVRYIKYPIHIYNESICFYHILEQDSYVQDMLGYYTRSELVETDPPTTPEQFLLISRLLCE